MAPLSTRTHVSSKHRFKKPFTVSPLPPLGLQFTFQYTLWDKFKQLSTLSARQMLHLSRLLVHLIREHALSLAILKVVAFAELDMKSGTFFKLFLTQLLLELPEDGGVPLVSFSLHARYISKFFLLVKLGAVRVSAKLWLQG